MFDGKTYTPSDGPRLGRQLAQVASLMRDGQWRTTQSVSARLRDLRKPRYGSHPVERRRVSAGVFQYRVCA